MEQEWPAGLSERQIAKFVEDDEVHAGQVVGEPALAAGASFGLEPVDEIDHVVEPAAGTATDAASGNGDGQMGLAGTGPADQHGVALLGDEAAAGEVVDERFVDRRALELEVVEVLGERQLGDGELVLDRARLLLAQRADMYQGIGANTAARASPAVSGERTLFRRSRRSRAILADTPAAPSPVVRSPSLIRRGPQCVSYLSSRNHQTCHSSAGACFLRHSPTSAARAHWYTWLSARSMSG